jgi:hypothetical protein
MKLICVYVSGNGGARTSSLTWRIVVHANETAITLHAPTLTKPNTYAFHGSMFAAIALFQRKKICVRRFVAACASTTKVDVIYLKTE